jgi:hypothetical protein
MRDSAGREKVSSLGGSDIRCIERFRGGCFETVLLNGSVADCLSVVDLHVWPLLQNA